MKMAEHITLVISRSIGSVSACCFSLRWHLQFSKAQECNGVQQPTGVDGQRVAREIVMLRAALKTQGYKTRKLPKQALWVIQVNPSQAYRLSFQTDPNRAWVLHPFEQTLTYQHLFSVIQGALTSCATPTEVSTMTYADRLSPWCIICALPNLKRLTVARFRRRGDAEAHLTTLRRMMPQVVYELVLDPGLPCSTDTKSS